MEYLRRRVYQPLTSEGLQDIEVVCSLVNKICIELINQSRIILPILVVNIYCNIDCILKMVNKTVFSRYTCTSKAEDVCVGLQLQSVHSHEIKYAKDNSL